MKKQGVKKDTIISACFPTCAQRSPKPLQSETNLERVCNLARVKLKPFFFFGSYILIAYTNPGLLHFLNRIRLPLQTIISGNQLFSAARPFDRTDGCGELIRALSSKTTTALGALIWPLSLPERSRPKGDLASLVEWAKWREVSLSPVRERGSDRQRISESVREQWNTTRAYLRAGSPRKCEIPLGASRRATFQSSVSKSQVTPAHAL